MTLFATNVMGDRHPCPGKTHPTLEQHSGSERGTEMQEAGAAAYINKSKAASTIGDAIRACCGLKVED